MNPLARFARAVRAGMIARVGPVRGGREFRRRTSCDIPLYFFAGMDPDNVAEIGVHDAAEREHFLATGRAIDWPC